MAAYIETWFNQDLQNPVQVHYLDGNLFSNNGNGNVIGVRLTNRGEYVTIAGTVSGYAVLSDGTTVPCTGSKSGNEASILVPAGAYLPGTIFVTIFLTDGEVVTTLAALSANVLQTRTDSMVDPGSVISDWTDTINAAMQAVEDAAENIGHIVATPYSSLTFPVPLGKYTFYDNNVYRCTTAIPSSENFTAAHWSPATNIGDELKNEVDDRKEAVTEEATARANGDANSLAQLAKTFDTETAFVTGEYCIYNNELYLFIADHSAGSWNSAHVRKVKACDEIRDLDVTVAYNAEANQYGYSEGLPAYLFEINKWSEGTGNSNTNNKWIRTKDFIHATGQLYFDIITQTAMQIYVLAYLRSDGSYDASKLVRVTADSAVNLDDKYKYKLSMAYATATTITDVEAWYNGNVRIYGTPSVFAEDVTEIEKQLYGGTPEPPAFEYGRYSEGTGNPLQPVNTWIRTADFLTVGQTLRLVLGTGVTAYLLKYNKDGTYTTEYAQYTGTNNISLDPHYKFMLNMNNDGSAISDISTFLGTNTVSYLFTDGLISEVRSGGSFWAVPATVYALVGEESRIYFNEIFATTKEGFFEISVTGATYPEITYTSDYISMNFTSAKSCTIEISFNDYNRVVIGTKTITVTAIATLSTIPAKKYMFLGDSLTNEGTLPSTFKTLMGNSATLYGTRTSKGVNHEGRPGWGISHYCDSASYGGITNPFYNPSTQGFDFSYYMTNNPSFADVDVVNIFLGRNNGYGVSYIDRLFDEIIASIKSYNSNIIVTIMWAYNTATDNSGAGRYLQNTYRITYNGKVYNAAMLSETFSNGLYLVPENLNFDNYYDYAKEEVNATPYTTQKRVVFTDNVHPQESGYVSWAHTLFTYMQNILS